MSKLQKKNKLVCTFLVYSYSVVQWCVSGDALGLLAGNATLISENFDMTAVFTVLTEVIRDNFRNSRLKQHLLPALGEFLFYAATQEENEGHQIPEWDVPGTSSHCCPLHTALRTTWSSSLMRVKSCSRNIKTSNWVAPCKPAPSDYFVAIFQVAQNFFSRMQKNMDKIEPPPSPLPPSLSISKQRRISIFEGQNTVHVSYTLLEGDWGGGGWTFKNVFEALLPCSWKKNTGTLFNTTTWKIATK